jgi:hypothetical protein
MTMTKFKFVAAGIVVAMTLSGCVNETSVFHSPDGKYTNVCSGAGFGLIRGTMAMAQYNNCRNAYFAAGYVEGPAPMQFPVATPR